MPRTRSLEIWHIPKRQNIHQIIGAVEILSHENFNGKSWTRMKQENFNTQLGRAGLTNNGRPLSPSARRTLEALIKYLGFIYIKNETNPPSMHVTPIGLELIKIHGSVIGKRKTLRQVKEHHEEIVESPIIKQQLIKLQINNPLIREDCNNILLFPFRIILQALLELHYLSKEEIASIIFFIKNKNEYAAAIIKIKIFRTLSPENKNKLIDDFKQTEIGNLTLVQAPTAIYFMGLCSGTGLCEKKYDNLYIKPDKFDEVRQILHQFQAIDPFNFHDNMRLWIDYIGSINRLSPPISLEIKIQHTNSNLYVVVQDVNGLEIGSCVITPDSLSCSVPVFRNEIYIFHIFDFTNGEKIYSESHEVNSNSIELNLNQNISIPPIPSDFTSISKQIFDLIQRKDFDNDYNHHIDILKKITAKNNFNIPQLRGGRLEYLFFQLLIVLKNQHVIDSVFWNGRINEFKIAYPALGGKEGFPDIYFFIDDNLFILELTTIRSNDMQWKAEAASVHDHILNLSKQIHGKYNLVGLFCAPTISTRVENMFKHISAHEKLPHVPITIENFIEILHQGRSAILNLLPKQ